MRQSWPLLVLVLLVGLAMATLRCNDADATPELVVYKVVGDVSLQRTDHSAVPVAPGTLLSALDQLTTGDVGELILRMGQDTEITVRPSSRVGVVGVEEDGVTLELLGGALTLKVRPTSAAIRVQNRAGQVVETRDGLVEVGGDEGTLLVRPLEGTATVVSGDEVVTVPADSQVTVVDGTLLAGPVDEELLLKVLAPDAVRTREQQDEVVGLTAPGARVRVIGPFGERWGRAGVDGGFRVAIPLVEGANPVEVSAFDALGSEARVAVRRPDRDTQGPMILHTRGQGP